MFARLKFIAPFAAIMMLLSCSKSSGGKDENTGGNNPPETHIPDNHVVAHRGAYKEFGLPENSVASLEKAMEINCFAAECDIMLTKDKQVIVYHDEKIGGQYFKDIDYADILTNHTLGNGEKIPLLAALLDKVVVNKKIQFWIDVKSLSDEAGGNEWSSQAAEAAAAVIRAKQAQQYVAFVVGRKAVLDRSIAAAKGEWSCGYMNTDYTSTQFVNSGYTWANFTYSKFYTNASTNNAALIADYKAKKLKVTVYTVDDEEAMNWFIGNNNIDAITTNYPFKLLQKLKK